MERKCFFHFGFHHINKDLYLDSITLTLSRGWWGRCEKTYLSKEEEREGGEAPGLKPGTYRVLGEGPQLYATGVV